MKQSPKVVVIGAGSLFFGMGAIWQMTQSKYLNTGTLALVDTNEETLRKYEALAKKVAAHCGVSLRIEASTNRRDVLPDADFVILSFANNSIYYRDLDCKITEKHGIRMCSGDTIGPGGIFRALRDCPEILRCADDVRELCPNAFLINYINPTAVHGIALQRYAPDLKTFALCDGNHMPDAKILYAIRAGIIKDKAEFTEEVDKNFDFRIAGVNHFTWILKAEYKGKDVMPNIAAAIYERSAKETDGGDTGAKAIYNEQVGYELWKAYGVIPTAVSHTKEYVRFWQGRNILPQSIPPLSLWNADDRYKRTADRAAEVDAYLRGEKTMDEFVKTFNHDHATDIIENIVGNLGKQYYINTVNGGAVTNMQDDAFLELLCDIDWNGPRPVKVGALPTGIRGMEELVLDTHVLTADAIIKRDKKLLRQALLTDPLTCSISDVDAIMEELLELEKDAITIELQ